MTDVQKKILLVEDEAMLALMETMWLNKAGYEVVTASSGEKAIDLVNNYSSKFDIILMDIDLGKGIDGTQAAQEILKTNEIPILFLSSHTELDIVEKTENISSYGYVVKGSDEIVLLASIHMAFKLFEAKKGLEQKDYWLTESQKVAKIGSYIFNITSGEWTYSKVLLSILGIDESYPANSEYFFNLIFIEDRKMVQEHFQSLNFQKHFFDIEFRIQKQTDNKIIWIHGTGKILFDETNNSSSMLGTMQDISERKKQEIALSESEERFKTFFDKAPLGYQSLDFDGFINEVNSTWLEMLGYDKKEVVGRWFGDFLAPGFADAFKLRFPLFKKWGKVHSEFEMVKKDGSHIFAAFEGRIAHKQNGGFQRTHCVLSDITEKKEFEKKLHRNSQLLSLFVQNAPAAIAMFDSQMHLVMCSNAFIKDYKILTSEINSKSFYDILPEMPENWKNIFSKCFEGITHKVDNDSVVLRDGSFKSVRWEITPWYEEDNSIGGVSFYSEFIPRKINFPDNINEK